MNVHLTNPIKSDTDSDGLPDGYEIQTGSNPNVSSDFDSDGDGFVDGVDLDPLHDIWLNVNLSKMATNSTEFGATIYDVTFTVRIKDVSGNLLKQATYTCPDDRTSYVMNWTISYNIPDNNTQVVIEITARDPSYPAPFWVGQDLDLTGGWNNATNPRTDPLGVYFYFNVKTGSWYEKYGGDQGSDGITSGWDDGVGGQDVTLWYWLYKSYK